MPDGSDVVVERVVAPPVVTPRGLVWAFDPMSFEWQGVSLKIQLRGELQPVEVAVMRHQTPQGRARPRAPLRSSATCQGVKKWTELPSARLSVDKGCGAFVAADWAADVVAIADVMEWPYVPERCGSGHAWTTSSSACSSTRATVHGATR